MHQIGLWITLDDRSLSHWLCITIGHASHWWPMVVETHTSMLKCKKDTTHHMGPCITLDHASHWIIHHIESYIILNNSWFFIHDSNYHTILCKVIDHTCWAEINLWKLLKNSVFVDISNVIMACCPISERQKGAIQLRMIG